MASRRIEDLYPQTRARAEKLLAQANAAGIRLFTTSTFRDFAEQNALYEQGRSGPGRRVTNAKGGESYHNVRRALDVAFLRPVTGVLDWTWLDSAEAGAIWRRLGAMGATLGLQWGGLWRRPDRPHFEDSFCAVCSADQGASGAPHFDETGRCRLARKLRETS